MKLTMILLLSALLPGMAVNSAPQPHPDSLLLVSWNVENLLDYRTDSTGRHTKSRFRSKCSSIAKTILLIADSEGRIPDAVALMEVGDRFVLEQLLRNTALRKLDYSILHFDSSDRRGIDCALLYRRSSFPECEGKALHLFDENGRIMTTRDILSARFGPFALLVNHHPSKVGSDSERRRSIAMARMNFAADSLMRAGCKAVVACGDFNDDLWEDGSQGTIKYNGAWEKIDGHFLWGEAAVNETVFLNSFLLERDRSFGGMKPRRSFSGPRFLGGVSDHLPLVLRIEILSGF